MDDLNDIIERLSVFKNLYDMLRIVDPLNKKTIIVKGNVIMSEEGSCYGLWKKSTFCENCTSMRAFNEKDTMEIKKSQSKGIDEGR